MDIYKPYRLIEESDKWLELAIGSARKRSLFIFLRIFPIFLMALALAAYSVFSGTAQSDPDTRLFLYVLPGLLLLSAFSMMIQKYIVGLKVEEAGIQLTRNLFPGRTAVDFIPQADCSSIEYRIVGGRGGGGFIYVVSPNHEKTQILNVPMIFCEEKNIEQIARTISKILKIPVALR